MAAVVVVVVIVCTLNVSLFGWPALCADFHSKLPQSSLSRIVFAELHKRSIQRSKAFAVFSGTFYQQ